MAVDSILQVKNIILIVNKTFPPNSITIVIFLHIGLKTIYIRDLVEAQDKHLTKIEKLFGAN